MATVPRITSRPSSLAGTRMSHDNSHFVCPPRTPYPDTCSNESTLAYSTTSSSRSPSQRLDSIPSTQLESTSSQSLPPSPLDNIPPRLHARFPRFSTTTEISQPDLSIEDVTSTRFSVDEEGIISVSYKMDFKRHSKQPGRLHRTIKKAISHQTMFLKKAKFEVRRIPSNWRLVSRPKDKSSHLSGSSPEESVEDSGSENAPVLPSISRQSDDLQLKTEAEESDPFVYGGTVRGKAYRPVSKLSALEEHRNSLDSNQETPRAVTAITYKAKREPVTQFPPSTLRYRFPPPSFLPQVSTTTVNTYHTALERPPLRKPSPLARSSREIPRGSSSGSAAADNRIYPFSTTQERLGSTSNLSSRQNSMVSLSQTLNSRPYSSYSRPASSRSDDWRASLLQREAMFVEMSSQSKAGVSFVFPSKLAPDACRASLSSQPHSRATSIHSFQSNIDRPVIIRSTSMVQVSHRDENYRKVPLFVPARIERHDMAGYHEPSPLTGRRDSMMAVTDGVCDDTPGSWTSQSELSNWSMTYQESPIGRVSVDLQSDSATIRPSKRKPLKDIMNHFSTKKPRHSNFVQGCGSCVRRLSRVLKVRQAEALTSASTEKLRP